MKRTFQMLKYLEIKKLIKNDTVTDCRRGPTNRLSRARLQQCTRSRTLADSSESSECGLKYDTAWRPLGRRIGSALSGRGRAGPAGTDRQ